MPVLLLCFLLLASIQQSPVTASNSENIPDDSQENLSPSSESELDEASMTGSNPSAGDNWAPADNVTPPTESELNGPDITEIYPPFSENSESMGQNVTPFDDNFMLENGPDLTRCSLPSPDPTDNDPWVGVKVRNNDDDQHTVYIYVDGAYKGYLNVGPYGGTAYSDLIYVWHGWHKVKIRWYDHDYGAWYSQEYAQEVMYLSVFFFELPLKPPPPTGYAYAEIYNADDDQHDVYVYLDGAYKGYVKVPSETTRYTSYYTVSVGDHTMKIKWYDEDDARWHEDSREYYVSDGEYQQYHFELPPILPPRGYLRVGTYNADDDSHNIDVYVDGAYWTQIYASSDQTVSTDWRTVSVENHTVEIQWYDYDVKSWYSLSRTEYVSLNEWQEFYFELPIIRSYEEIVSSLPAELPAFTESVTNPSFAGGTPFIHTYDPSVNIARITAPDYSMEIEYPTSRITLDTAVLDVSGYTNPELGENPPLVSGSTYVHVDTFGNPGLHFGTNLTTEEKFAGPTYSLTPGIPIPVSGRVMAATGDQGTISASVDTPMVPITPIVWAGLYGSTFMRDTEGAVIGGVKAGLPVACVSAGAGGYWDEVGWGLQLNGDIEVGPLGGSGDLKINLKPIADGLAVVGQCVIEGGKFVVDKIGDAIGFLAGAGGNFLIGTKRWTSYDLPPMPEDVRIALEKIRNDFQLELYEILTTTPIKARDRAESSMLRLEEIIQDEDIRNKLAQAIFVVEQTGNDFADTWRIKSLSFFDEIKEATDLIAEAIAQAEQKEPTILDNLMKIRSKLIDVVGLLAGDMVYDAKVAEGYPELIALADNAFLDGDYKTAYISALISTDVTPPISYVNLISPYWQISTPFDITVTGTDIVDNFTFEELVASVELFYRYSGDNATWSDWTSFGIDISAPWSWAFDAPEGDGYYEFHSIATDEASNVEEEPEIADTVCGVDTVPPESSVDLIEPYWQNASMVPFEVLATASDNLSGVASVELYYRYSVDNTTWDVWISYGIDNGEPWSWTFDASEGDGYCEFYTVATDVAFNTEPVPDQANLNLGVDTMPAISSVDPIEPYWQESTSFTLSVIALDALSGVTDVELYYQSSIDNENWSEWKLFGIDNVAPYEWSFTTPDGYGLYQFYSVTTDVAGNVENAPEAADATCCVVIPAEIAIDPDTLNLESQGRWITAYIELSGVYDLVSIDLSTITLDSAAPAEPHPTEICDHDNDGIPDLMIKFDRSAVQSLVSVGEIELVITGKWHAVLFKGSDAIRVIEPGKEQRGNRPEAPPGQSDEHPGKRFETPPGQSGEHPSQGQGKGKTNGKDKG